MSEIINPCSKCKTSPRFKKSCYCKPCADAYAKEYRTKNAEKARESTKRWRAANLEYAKEACRKYYREHPEEIKDYNRKYYAENREACVKYSREYRAKNPLAHMKSQYRTVTGIPSIKPGSCEICGSANKVVMDHCHERSQFRGWICNDCNLALGFAADDPTRLRKMADYLDAALTRMTL